MTFSTTARCALSNVSGGAGTGSATVTVLSAGFCNITASQAGTTTYNPAPSVTQQVFTLLAVLTVTASSPTITYGETAPAITPSYSGFVNGDTTARADRARDLRRRAEQRRGRNLRDHLLGSGRAELQHQLRARHADDQ